MKGFFIIIVTLLFHASYLSAQRHDNTLVFGYEGGKFSPNNDFYGLNILTFPEGSLHLSDNQSSPLDVFNTCASISDLMGRLLFYTNGRHIEDADFKAMPYGRNITPLCWTRGDCRMACWPVINLCTLQDLPGQAVSRWL